MTSPTQEPRYYLISETDPRIRIFAGSTREAACMRLIHAQHNSPYARYRIASEEN